ncbi:hypothetical protein [Tepidiforma flava]
MASIANATAPLWAAVLAVAFLRDEPLTLQKSLGLALGFTGIVSPRRPRLGRAPFRRSARP